MKRLLRKLESLAQISFLQIKDAQAWYGQLSTQKDKSESYDSSQSYDTSGLHDYSMSYDYYQS